MLYMRWHGHVTGAELVRAARTSLPLNRQWQLQSLFQDARGAPGEWRVGATAALGTVVEAAFDRC